MVTPAEVLLENSTLESGTPWEHLNAQAVGTGETLVLMDGLLVELDNGSTNIIVDGNNLTTIIPSDNLDVLLDQEAMDIAVDDVALTTLVLSDSISVEIAGCTVVTAEGGDMVIKVAAESVGGHRIVTVNAIGQILHADKDLIVDGKKAIGMTIQAATAGSQCFVAISGDEVTEPSWNWDTSLPIYLGDDGVMTQVAPTEKFILIVAVPLTPTSIRVRIEMPIFL